ncbi:MAG: hypothetical protein ACJ74H_09460 [Thermoanaerobaculia bacterium]
MSEYDKELQTGTDEYEKAIEPLQKAEKKGEREKTEEPADNRAER